MNPQRLRRAINLALESAAVTPRELVKLSQDDYDDGVQVLVLQYSDGTYETTTRCWPDLVQRGAERGDSLHEWFDEIREIADDPNQLWAMIQVLTEPGPTHDLYSRDRGSPSTEGWVGDRLSSAKDAIMQWTVGIRKWKAGEWSKLSEADQLLGIKKADLTFFYHNPKYVKHLEQIFKYTKSLSELVVKTGNDEVLTKTVELLNKELTIIVKAAGVRNPETTLSGLQHQFKSAMKSYKAPENVQGDVEAINQIVVIMDRYKLSVSTLDALKVMARSVGLEGDRSREELEFQASIISCILFFSGLWPLWIVWLLGIRDFYVNSYTGGPDYE